MKEESLILLSDLQKLINQVVLIDYTIIILGGAKMAVFRIEKTRDYTVMSNYHLRDTSLSLKAKGLLSLMLSLPEN